MKHKHLIALALTTALAPSALRADETDHWRFDTSLNLFMAGLSGDVTARGQPASVDVGFGEIVENLELGAAGRFTVGYDRWSLSTEVSFMGLGASKDTVSVDMDQWLVEPSLGYKVSEYFGAFAGVRYNNINGEIRGPFGRVPSGTQDWWDPIVGANLSLPLVRNKLTLRRPQFPWTVSWPASIPRSNPFSAPWKSTSSRRRFFTAASPPSSSCSWVNRS